VQEAAAFAADPAKWLAALGEEPNLSARRSKAAAVLEALSAARGADWPWCVAAARRLAHEHFYSAIRQLLHNFPQGYCDPKTGVPFWSPPKRTPTACEFDAAAQPEHAAFVAHAAALFAANFGVALPAGEAAALAPAALAPLLAAAEAALPPWEPKGGVRIKASDADATVEGADDDGEAVAALTAQLRAAAADAPALAALRLVPAEFEKDDDANHHIAFITAASNLRAANYRIPQTSFFQVKLIAGKIIPAVATTTAAVTGLVGLELLKAVRGAGAAAARNAFMNLAINVYARSEPAPPTKTLSVANDPISMGPVRALPEGFTRWDRVKIAGEPRMTPARLAAWLGERHGGLRMAMITYGRSILYNPMLYRGHVAARGDKPLRDIVEEVIAAAGGKPLGDKGYILLDVSCEDDEGDVVIPPVQLMLR
jgi:ubiquitin-activating enzyme E1